MLENGKLNFQTVKEAAKSLGVSKGKIKSLIRDESIVHSLISGNYYVDVDEVKEVISIKEETNYSKFLVSDLGIYTLKTMGWFIDDTKKKSNLNMDEFDVINGYKQYLKDMYLTYKKFYAEYTGEDKLYCKKQWALLNKVKKLTITQFQIVQAVLGKERGYKHILVKKSECQ